MKIFDLISIGGITVDLYFKGGNMPFDANDVVCLKPNKYQVDFFQINLGGGGMNVASSAAKAGLKTAVIGTVGNNAFKQIILDKIRDAGVSHEFCRMQDDFYAVSAILLGEHGERTIITYKTPDKHLLTDMRQFLIAGQAQAVFMGNLPDVSISHRAQVLKMSHEYGAKTILNLGMQDCIKPFREIQELLLQADMIVCNRFELTEILKLPEDEIDLNTDLIGLKLPQLVSKIFVVTDAGNGSYCYHNGIVQHQPGYCPAKIVDTTGAGDAYTGVLIAEYLHTGDIAESMKKANKYACSVISKVGSS